MVEQQKNLQDIQKIDNFDWKSHKFEVPTKKIITEEDIKKFQKSQSFLKYMEFIIELQKSVQSKPISSTKPIEKFKPIVDFLTRIEELIKETPPIQQPMRFGNKAFRTWYDKVKIEIGSLLKQIIPKQYQKNQINDQEASVEVELQTYLMQSFGSYERIDYGTGHEMHFILFMYCLNVLCLIQKNEYENFVRDVFYKYIKLMRNLQLTYMLEPAGSHGVWGLDDYHFIPFLFGAAELIDNNIIKTPNDIHNDNLVNQYAEEYMYLNCIRFIKQVKKNAPFHECSPVLNDISATFSWTKVAMGMIKMYQAEVLFKHPVIKHTHFGSLFSL